jgi:hypothetical protein
MASSDYTGKAREVSCMVVTQTLARDVYILNKLRLIRISIHEGGKNTCLCTAKWSVVFSFFHDCINYRSLESPKNALQA